MRRVPMMGLSRAFFGVFCAFAVGCTGSVAGPGGQLRTLSPGADAQEAYENALAEFRDDNCLDAEPAFRRIRREYPYSRFAALSELRVADCKFKQASYAEAITAYRQFVRFRPSHSQVEYASFRVAESHYKQIPSEWLLSPPSHERDLSSTVEALRQMRRYVLDYPESERMDEAQEIIQKCLDVLATHELYVARFYLRRDAYPAVVNRLNTLLRSYEGSSVEAEALLLLAETLQEMGEEERARMTYEELVARHPDADESDTAQSRLRR